MLYDLVTGCVEGELRFESNNSFLVQMCTKGKWGYVCARYHYNWSKKEAQVACQLMGYLSTDLNKIGKNANTSMLGQQDQLYTITF